MNKLFTTLVLMGFAVTLMTAQIKVVAPNGHTMIGEGTPTEKLDVDGNAIVRGAQISVGTSVAGGNTGVNVGKGRTANGSATFDFVSDVTNYGAWGFRLLRGSTGVSRFSHRGTNDFLFATNDAAEMRFLTNNITRLTIQANGQVDIAGSATVNGGVAVTSDKRLKNNISTLDMGLSEVLQLEPVSYRYNGKGGTSAAGRNYVGLIAQDLQKIAPIFVSEHDYVEKDELGNIITEQSYLKIHDSEIKYLLVNAIKEQNTLIEDQKDQIANLEERLSQIEAILENQVSNTQNELIENGGVLYQNVPNPASDNTLIDYEVPTNAQSAQLKVVNSEGRLIEMIEIENLGKGSINLNIKQLTSGIYHYYLVVNGNVIANKKMVLTK